MEERERGTRWAIPPEERARAAARDAADPLARFRGRFRIPEGTIYMDGNSLGLASLDAEASLERALDSWRRLAVRGWLEAEPAWFDYGERIGAKMAPLVGARPTEVLMSGSTTVNLHALVSTFYRPEGRRRRILADELNFPSDLYALAGQIRLRGGDPGTDLILAESPDGRTLDEGVLLERMDDTVALALLPSVLYRSGQLLDMERLARGARERGVILGFDCAHSAGSVPHEFDRWGVDFALWCGYKHLNGGPGAPAFLYVNERHFDREPGLPGWFGHARERQFDMALRFDHDRSARGWQIGTPFILSAAALDGALDLFAEAGIGAVREKSLALTEALIEGVDRYLSGPDKGFAVGTPRERGRRGGHVAVEHPEAWRICCALKARGIVPDFRPDRVIRIAPVALYNTFEEVRLVLEALGEIVEGREYERFPRVRDAVS